MAEEQTKPEMKQEAEEKKEEKTNKEETKAEEKTAAKKGERKEEIKKKNYAFANGRNMRISWKSAGHICDMIRYKKIDTAIALVEEVIAMKRAVRMNNREVGHRKGIGIMAGRFPINTAKEMLPVLKQLKANAIHNGIEIEDAVITLCKADKASQPYKRGGSRAKRAHLLLKLEMVKKNKSETSKGKSKGAKK